MESIKRSQVTGRDAAQVAALLGYAPGDVRGVAVEPDEVLVVVVDSADQILQQSHPIVEG